MLHLCVRHVAAPPPGYSAQVGLSGIYMEMVPSPSPPSAPSPFCIYTEATPRPFLSQWDTGYPSLQRDTRKTTSKRLHSRVDRCLWQVDKGLQATDRLDTHYDAPTYLRVPTAWHSRGLFVRGLAAADKAEWGRRPD